MILQFQRLGLMGPSHLDILTELLDGENNVARHALQRLRVSFQDLNPNVHVPYNLAIAKQVDILILFCGGDELYDHPIRDAVLRSGAFSVVLRLLESLIIAFAMDIKYLNPIRSCLTFASELFTCRDGEIWVRYGLRHGILQTFWSLGFLYGRLDDLAQEEFSDIVNVLCRFMNIRKTRNIAVKFLSTLDTADMVATAPSEFAKIWTRMVDSLIRSSIQQWYSVNDPALCCHNVRQFLHLRLYLLAYSSIVLGRM